MEQFTSNGSDTANPLLKEPNPTVLYLILRKEREERVAEGRQEKPERV